jgi:hypothetical protein
VIHDDEARIGAPLVREGKGHPAPVVVHTATLRGVAPVTEAQV